MITFVETPDYDDSLENDSPSRGRKLKFPHLVVLRMIV